MYNKIRNVVVAVGAGPKYLVVNGQVESMCASVFLFIYYLVAGPRKRKQLELENNFWTYTGAMYCIYNSRE